MRGQKMAMSMGENWAQFGSLMATSMFVWTMFRRFFPTQLQVFIHRWFNKLVLQFFNPFVEINFQEFTGLRSNAVYTAIDAYLNAKCINEVKRLKGESVRNNKSSIVLKMDDGEEMLDAYKRAKLQWRISKNIGKVQSSSNNAVNHEKWSYQLKFHKKYRDLIIGDYLNHVVEEGNTVLVRDRQRKLYTNNSSASGSRYTWSSVVFEHPASLETLAMDPKLKEEIVDDLSTFSEGKEYYKRIGKAWKRGYLLYGPPGTGKSTLIAAMANYLNYDIYDIELTAVKDNMELRKLFVETSNKSIIVIEDIDCSLDITSKRMSKKINVNYAKGEEESKVTLSGLLTVIDGLWSACGGERIIVFTTNKFEKLDEALIRRGRMDKHIELSYSKLESFKVLAKNYLDLDSHELFETIGRLLEETNMTPADVAENLTHRNRTRDAETCLKGLIEALEIAKETGRLKAEEKRLKKEAKEKELSAKLGNPEDRASTDK